MQKNRISLFFLFLIASLMPFQAAVAKTGSIKGVLKNSQSYPYIYLYQAFGAEYIKLDSAKLMATQFEIKPKTLLPRGFYKLAVDDKSGSTFVYDNSDLVVEMDMAMPGAITIQGSKENEAYFQYLTANARHSEEFKKLDAQAQQFMELRYSDPARFNTEIGKLQLKLDSLNKVLREQLVYIASTQKGTFASKVSTMFVQYDTTTQAGFFTKEEYTDEEYTRGDMLANKIYIYIQRYYQQADTKIGCAKVLSGFAKNNANKEVAYASLIRFIYQQDQEYARELAEKYGKDFPNSKYAKFYLENIPKGSPKIGEIPPDIKLANTAGKDISLYSLKGKVVLLDFWASWCGPCRKENPNVVQAYNKFKDKGFTVFSVSLDNNKDQWLAAIRKDGLIWENHVSDLKGWNSSAAKLYGVRGIPAAFLLDKNGKIVATNLRGLELEKAIENLFSE